MFIHREGRLDIEKTPNTNDRQIDQHYTDNVNFTTYA